MNQHDSTIKCNQSEVQDFHTLPLDSFHFQSKLLTSHPRSEKFDYSTENECMFISEIRVSETIPRTVRIIFLVLLSTVLVGYNYHLYSFITLQSQIESSLGITQFSYMLIFAITFAPSVVLPYFLGGFLDKIGAGYGLTCGSLTFLIGDTIIFLGFYLRSIYLVYFGCLFFGIGIDIMLISQFKMVQKWYRGKDLSLVLGFIATITNITILGAGLLGPVLYNVGKSGGSILIPVSLQCLVTLASVLASGGLYYLDRKYNHVFLQNMLVETNKVINLKAFKLFPSLFWYIAIASVCGYSTFLATTLFASKFLQERFSLSANNAGIIRLTPQCVVIFIAPFIGKLTDSYGKKMNFLIIAYLLLWVSLIMSAFIPPDSSLIAILALFILQGLYSSINSVCPNAAMMLIIKTQNMGVAYGLYMWFNGIMLVVLMFVDHAIINATKTDNNQGYFWIFLLLALLPTLALGLVLFAKLMDPEKGHVINEAPHKIRASIWARSASSFRVTLPQSEEK